MAKKAVKKEKTVQAVGKPSSLIDTRVIYCGDNLEQLKKFPDECVDLIYIDPPFNSNQRINGALSLRRRNRLQISVKRNRWGKPHLRDCCPSLMKNFRIIEANYLLDALTL
jgi:DNA modification methylase